MAFKRVHRVLVPACFFLLSRACVMAAALNVGKKWNDLSAYKQWDSHLYLDIAQNGYSFITCQQAGYASSGWCGNAGWFPGYPLLMRKVAEVFGISQIDAGVWISAFFFLLTLLVAWNGLLHQRRAGWVGMLALAVFPGMVYDHAVFPISLVSFCILAACLAVSRGRWFIAFLSAAGAGFAYSTGPLLGLTSIPFVVVALFRGQYRRAWDFACVTLGAALGFAGVLALQWKETQHWNAFFLVQEKYKHGASSPFSIFVTPLRNVFHVSSLGMPESSVWIGLQTGVTALLVVAIWFSLRRDRAKGDVLLAAVATSYWMLPHLLGASVSLYRSEALVFPLALLVPRLDRPARGAFLLVFGLLAFEMSRLYFTGTLR